MYESSALRQQILQLFGPEAYLETHELDRAFLASKVFSDPSLLRQLNALVHPAVYTDLKQWSQEDSQLAAPYLIQESAILFEENLTDRLQSIILVVAPEETRIERVMKRDGSTREQVGDRMKHQWMDEKKIPLSDYIIYNDSERSLIAQVSDINQMIRNIHPSS